MPVKILLDNSDKEKREPLPKLETAKSNNSTQTIEPNKKDSDKIQATGTPELASKTGVEDPDMLWTQLLDIIKKDHNTLYGILRMAKPAFSDSELKLHFGFKFHQQRVNESQNCQIISKILLDLSGQNYTIECILDDSARPKLPVDTAIVTIPLPEEGNDEQTLPLETINSIFGGGEIIG
jgi:hypothetical protein